MISLSRNEIIALFKQFQQHSNCESVHIRRGIFGKLVFEFRQPKKKEEPKKKELPKKK